MTPEFSRRERLDTIGEAPRDVAIEAGADERAALARRFALVAIDRLSARLAIQRTPGGIAATGRVRASVVQACAVTGAPVPATIDEDVALRFVSPGGTEAEVELSDDALDTIEIDGDAIDLGEAAAETVALALDPFPRAPGAAAVLAAAGVKSEAEAGPFGGLAALRDKLTPKS